MKKDELQSVKITDEKVQITAQCAGIWNSKVLLCYLSVCGGFVLVCVIKRKTSRTPRKT